LSPSTCERKVSSARTTDYRFRCQRNPARPRGDPPYLRPDFRRPRRPLKVDPAGICLIASHVWDTLGAVAASWQAALILREGNAPLDVGPQPDYIGKDLDVVADQLIERYATAASAGPGRKGADRP